MKPHWLPIGALVLVGTSAAQLSILLASDTAAGLKGLPKNPPIFSQMTVILQGNMQFVDKPYVKGPVAEVHREQSPPEQSPNPYHVTETLRFDEQGHLISKIFEDGIGVSTETDIYSEGRLQSHTVSRRSKKSKNESDWQDWEYRKYDEKGRLSDLRAGSNSTESVHYLNFKYDTEGRLLGAEYRDAYSTILTVISCAGRTVTTENFSENRKTFQGIQVVDDKDRTVDLRVSDLNEGQLKLWYHTAFKYDEQGRVIQQDTDPFKLGSGDDDSPIPGKLVVQYDDDKHWGEQKFYDPDGKLVFHSRFQFDRDGTPTKFVILDQSGKEVPGTDIDDASARTSAARSGTVEWEIVYDNRGNWTERRRWFTPADGSPRIMTRLVRQTITYR